MNEISRDKVRALMSEVLVAHGQEPPADDATALTDIGFRSLHFAELALRVEDEVGAELNFDAPQLRSIETVDDVLDFLAQLETL